MAVFSATLLLLALSGDSTMADPEHQPVSCAYDDRTDHGIAFHEDCGWIDAGGRPHVKPKYWRRFAFDRHGLIAVRLGNDWYWFDRSGRWSQTMLYDTWAEDFSDGLVRSPRGGKIGFVDRSLRLVIPARYDGALPFDGGVAEACIGCRLVQHGEHWMYEGGAWFCIDPRGRERRREGDNC
jgi:hypothetical protein